MYQTSREEEPEYLIEPSAQTRSNGAIDIHIPAPQAQWMILKGWIARGKTYLGFPTADIFRCPNGHERPYFLKREEQHPPNCADCGVPWK